MFVARTGNVVILSRIHDGGDVGAADDDDTESCDVDVADTTSLANVMYAATITLFVEAFCS